MSGRARPTRPRRAELSQHFLRGASATRLVQATSVSKSDLVLEIGPGRGALTTPLTKIARKVVAIELDAHLAESLRGRASSNLDVVTADFLQIELPTERYCVVGNIPYAISTEIIRKLDDAVQPPTDAWLVMQREVAFRMCGRPYTRENLWSLRLKPKWHLEVVRHLKKQEFDPPPSVESVFLNMRHRGRVVIEEEDLLRYVRLLEEVFRRNTPLNQSLRPWLSKLQIRRLAADLRFNVGDMPGDLMFEQWLGIFRFCRSNVSSDE